jgi:hypothetical protein
VLLAVVGPRANAAEIKVFTARAGATVLEKISPEFERATGNKLNVITGFGPRFVERIDSGESSGPKSWRPAPPQAAKIELEKPESISRASAKNFLARFSLG